MAAGRAEAEASALLAGEGDGEVAMYRRLLLVLEAVRADYLGLGCYTQQGLRYLGLGRFAYRQRAPRKRGRVPDG